MQPHSNKSTHTSVHLCRATKSHTIIFCDLTKHVVCVLSQPLNRPTSPKAYKDRHYLTPGSSRTRLIQMWWPMRQSKLISITCQGNDNTLSNLDMHSNSMIVSSIETWRYVYPKSTKCTYQSHTFGTSNVWFRVYRTFNIQDLFIHIGRGGKRGGGQRSQEACIPKLIPKAPNSIKVHTQKKKP